MLVNSGKQSQNANVGAHIRLDAQGLSVCLFDALDNLLGRRVLAVVVDDNCVAVNRCKFGRGGANAPPAACYEHHFGGGC